MASKYSLYSFCHLIFKYYGLQKPITVYWDIGGVKYLSWKLQVSVSNWYITHLASSSMAVGLARHHRKLFLSCGWGIEDGASSYRYGERGSTEGQVLFVTIQATQRHPCPGAGVFLLISAATDTTAGPLLGWPTKSDNY